MWTCQHGWNVVFVNDCPSHSTENMIVLFWHMYVITFIYSSLLPGRLEPLILAYLRYAGYPMDKPLYWRSNNAYSYTRIKLFFFFHPSWLHKPEYMKLNKQQCHLAADHPVVTKHLKIASYYIKIHWLVLFFAGTDNHVFIYSFFHQGVFWHENYSKIVNFTSTVIAVAPDWWNCNSKFVVLSLLKVH